MNADERSVTAHCSRPALFRLELLWNFGVGTWNFAGAGNRKKADCCSGMGRFALRGDDIRRRRMGFGQICHGPLTCGGAGRFWLAGLAIGQTMKHLLPDRVELAAMAAMALGCALIVYYRPAVDLWMAAMAVPLFIVSSLMGLRRNWRETDVPRDNDGAQGSELTPGE